jgi:hypothetical protein
LSDVQIHPSHSKLKLMKSADVKKTVI